MKSPDFITAGLAEMAWIAEYFGDEKTADFLKKEIAFREDHGDEAFGKYCKEKALLYEKALENLK